MPSCQPERGKEVRPSNRLPSGSLEGGSDLNDRAGSVLGDRQHGIEAVFKVGHVFDTLAVIGQTKRQAARGKIVHQELALDLYQEMAAIAIHRLPGDHDKVLFRSDPVRTVLNQAKCDNQIGIQDLLPAADHRLRMLENEVDPDGLLIVVLILIDWRIMAIRVCIRCNGVPNSYVAPA